MQKERGAGAEAEETHEKLLIMNSLIELTEQNRDYKSLGVLLTYKYINPNVQHDQGDIDKDIERIMRAIGPMTLAGDIKEAFFPSEARNPPYDLIRSLPNAEQDLLIGKYETKRDNAIAAVDNTDSRMELLILLLIILGAMTPIIGIIPVIVVAVAYTLNAFPFNTLQNIETKHSNTCDRLEKEKKKRPALTFCPVRVNNPMNNSDCNRSTNAETVTPPTN